MSQNQPPTEPLRRPDAIVDNRLYPHHTLDHRDLRNAEFFAVPAQRSHFASQLLINEHLVIPTNDFGVVPALIRWMGHHAFEEALDQGTVSFLRRKGILAYAGNGAGIQEFLVLDTPKNPFLWHEKAFWGEMADSVELQLIHGAPSITKERREHLVQKVMGQSRTVSYPTDDFFTKNVETESYRDIRDTPELRAFLFQLAASHGHPKGEPIAMNRVPGIEAKTVQIASDGPIRSPADLAVRIAGMNMEIFLADFAGGTDLQVSEGAEIILKRKIARTNASVRLEGFAQLLEINGVPDIRPAVESGSLSLPEMWKLRQSRRGKKFREWLTNAQPESAQDLARLYLESLSEVSMMESLPARVIRFALTSGIGAVDPLIGGVVGLADGLFTEKYIRGYRPKLMFDELRKLFAKTAQ